MFLPTSEGRVVGIVTLPADDVVFEGPAVVLLPGGRAGAGVLPLFQSVARRLASAGQPVLRFDYPGAGLSATEEPLPQRRTTALVAELCAWLVDETGVDRLAVAGRCAGGRLALAMPAVDARVTTCVSVVPFFAAAGRSLRSKLAELDAKGPRLAQRLISAPRTERVREERQDPEAVAATFADDLRTAAGNARTSIVFGEHDPLLGDLRRFVSSRGLESSFEAVDLIVLPEARLHGLPNVDHERALGEVLAERLAATWVSHG